jgi:hypothetical protein
MNAICKIKMEIGQLGNLGNLGNPRQDGQSEAKAIGMVR